MGTSASNTLWERAQHLHERGLALLWQDSSTENVWRRGVRRALQISYAVLRDLGGGHLSLRAMGLVYYTVIAFVPLLALTFSVLKGLGVHNTMEPALLSLLQPFLGEFSTDITTNVVDFVDNIRVDVLSFVSIGILLYTVLAMMQKMELAFNFIWSVTQPRSLSNRISDYLFAIIGTPLLIMVSVGTASYVNTNFFVRLLEDVRFGAPILQFTGFITPPLFMSLAFAFAYRFIPNTRVNFGSAFIGGVVTTIAWYVMAWIFRNVIIVNSANAVIYATFFALILLMLFLYLGWLMLLVGSSVAFYHQYPSRTRTGRKPLRLSMAEQEEITLTIAALIIKHFRSGMAPWSLSELARYCGFNAQVVHDALGTLTAIGFLCSTADDPPRYLPCTSVEELDILSLRRDIRRHAIDRLGTGNASPEQRAIHRFLQDAEQTLEQQKGRMSFSELLGREEENPGTAENQQKEEEKPA